MGEAAGAWEPGDRVCVDWRRALDVATPGPPKGDGGPVWMAATVERVREDGWVLVRLAASGRVAGQPDRFAVPPDGVRCPDGDGGCGG